MKTEYLSIHELARAAALLRAGQVVAFPTETVYGLGADALNPAAIDKVFQAKGRPSDNPLIVHLHDPSSLGRVVSSVPIIAEKWMRQFWPGPLTIVMPKHRDVPLSVTAGLNTVAVRIPDHEHARSLIQLSGCPIAAPSANRSGRPSATTWQSVAEDLDGLIAAIVCDDPTRVGVESTVVDASGAIPRVLRQGGVTFEELAKLTPELLPYQSKIDGQVNSPGRLHRHYQPSAKVVLVDSVSEIEALQSQNLGRLPTNDRSRENSQAYIGLEAISSGDIPFAMVEHCESVGTYANRLFDFMRQADRKGVQIIWCQRAPKSGLGAAINDRLERAAED